MSADSLSVGDRIERIASDYTGGRRGAIIETHDGRARIQWDAGHPRTWVKFSALKYIGTATVRGVWMETPGSRHHIAIRTCKNEAAGTEWHEYQKR
jgi:hypothetical protein